MMSIYPHLNLIRDVLTQSLGTTIKYINVYASIKDINIQFLPQICLIPDQITVQESITDRRTVSAIRCEQEWSVLIMLRNSNDQRVSHRLVESMGDIAGQVISVLCKDILVKGGPVSILGVDRSESIDGGAIAGRIRFSTQFVFNA